MENYKVSYSGAKLRQSAVESRRDAGAPWFATLLSESKNGLVAKWLEETLRVFPETSTDFLLHQKDNFQNPVGCRLKENLGILFDGLIGPGQNREATNKALQDIMRILAVQDISASQSVAFLLEFQRIVRTKTPEALSPDECIAFELRIDELVSAGFDSFAKCRERINGLKANERKRMNFVDQRKSSRGVSPRSAHEK
jgi:hypothetical protein